jgi:hypothetical protein
MPDQSNAPAASGADSEPIQPAQPTDAVAIGDLVISWYDDEPVTYGGPGDRPFTTLSFEFLGKSALVRKCDPEQVAPADMPIPAKDARVSVVKCPRAEMPYGEAGPWKLTLSGVMHPSWHRTRRDGTATGLRRLAILDWHAARTPMFDERTRDYLRRARQADPSVLAPWRTPTCPECGATPGGDGLVVADSGDHAHVVLRGAVILGCEGYFVVDPAAVGLDRGQWEDWRGDLDAAYVNLDPDGGYQPTLFGADVGGRVGTYPEAFAALRAAVAKPHMAAAIDQASGLRVFYCSHITGLIVEFPVPLAQIKEDWDRPPRQEDEAWFAALPPHIGVEALCLLCGEVFNPHGPDDMTHGRRADEQPCGGPGVPLGWWE